MQTDRKVRGGVPAEFVAVWLGGGIGALLRFELTEVLPTAVGSWPWHTFTANVLACAILSFVIAHRQNGWGSDTRLALIGSGFCGGLSTFSALQLELFAMVDARSYLLAFTYLASSIAIGLAAITASRRYVSRGEDLA